MITTFSMRYTLSTLEQKSRLNNNRLLFIAALLVTSLSLHCDGLLAQIADKAPLVETYSASDRVRSGIALGGLGTGSVELRKDGQFYNWTIFNNQPLSMGEPFNFKVHPNLKAKEALQFFLVRYQEEDKTPKIKLLQLNNSVVEGGMTGINYYYPWMSAVSQVTYSGRFPFVNMTFTDPEMPFDIEMEAFSPFIPHDPKNSALPGVYFNFNIKATGSRKVNVMLIATQRNAVGYDTSEKYFETTLTETDTYKHFSQTVGGLSTKHFSFGQMGMASLSPATTHYLGWEHKHPYYERLIVENTLANINDTENRNMIDSKGKKVGRYTKETKDQRSFSSLAVTKSLKPGEQLHHSFVMTWYFPNNYGGHNRPKAEAPGTMPDYDFRQKITKNQGHFYENSFANADEVASYMIANKALLTQRTKQFLANFYASDAPQFVLDQINSQLNTFATSTTFTKNGNFGIREGLSEEKSWGPNNTIDVALYGSSAVIGLFPELQKQAMHSHRKLQTVEGEISHGLGYDLDFTEKGTWGVFHRMDMPGNYILQVTRDFFHTNDKAYLKTMWPSLQKAVNYVLDERDEDKDQMPDMTGIMCSYDNFPMYGLSSYIQSQWIAAMKSMAEAAKVIGDNAAVAKYNTIYEKGRQLMETHLWNGDYYILSKDYTGLTKNIEGATLEDQACLTDQLIGQWVGHQSGLGYLLDKTRIDRSLQQIYERSFKTGFGLRNCSWPQYPDLYPIHTTNLWVDQANTPWTGVELAFASFLIYEGYYEQGLNIIRDVDTRYRKAGLYWDHQEFGGHYYRPMSAWQTVNALLGLSINQDVYHFTPKLPQSFFTLFFAFDGGTAHYIKSEEQIALSILSGTFTPKTLVLPAEGFTKDRIRLYLDGK
ncbi:MAG: GH116 family glycosyl hydrolase, partial [Bacteroidota bacterium]